MVRYITINVSDHTSSKPMKKQKSSAKQKKTKKPLSKPKKIILIILEILGIIFGFFILMIAFTKYKHANHGYKTSDEVITKFITSWGPNYTTDMITCFNQDSATYPEVIDDILNDNHEKVKINKDDIEIIRQEDQNKNEIIKAIKESTKLNNISDGEMVRVIVKTKRPINGIDYHIETTCEFITYQYNNKWFIGSYRQVYSRQLNKVTEDDVGVTFIGDKLLGYIAVPDTWVDNSNNEPSDIILDEISSISPTEDAIITLNTISSDVSKSQLIDIICQNMNDKEMQYFTDTQKIGEYDATRITGIKDDTTNIIYVVSAPLIDNYIHTITLNCYTYDAEYYHDKYIQSFTLRTK